MKLQPDARLILRADGTTETLPAEAVGRAARIGEAIGADCLDTVTLRIPGLRSPLVMFVDDDGHARGLPRNERATELYLARCRPGATHFIVGDVAICPDSDFALAGATGAQR